MAKFVVDSRSLLAVRETLGRLQQQLASMNTVATGYHGVLGGAVLEAELEQFSRRWRYGIEVLVQRIGDMMIRLAAAAEAYAKVEDRIHSRSIA
jgi:hypothetical protein